MAAGKERSGSSGSRESGPAPVRWSLLQDNALILEVDPELTAVAGAWVPISHRDRRAYGSDRGAGGEGGTPEQSVGACRTALEAPAQRHPPAPTALLRLRVGVPTGGGGRGGGRGAPLLGLGSVWGWEVPDSGGLRLGGELGAEGLILPGARRADLTAPTGIDGSPEGGMEIHSLLTLSAGLVLPAVDAALVHAAGVVAPGVGALLLVGDSQAGKTTTCANLMEEGWRFLSDDHTVLRGGGGSERRRDGAADGAGEMGVAGGGGRAEDPGAAGGITVEGWLRTMHLDGGWRGGTPTGVREDTDPGVLAPGLWCASAPLAGLLFPRVEADRPTRIEPMTPGEALVGLIRQSPWLMADAGGAPRALAFLRRAALRPAFRLLLGTDTFRNGRRLSDVLEEAFPRGVRRAGVETT